MGGEYFSISLLLYTGILVVSCFMGSGALASSDLLLSYHIISLVSRITNI